MTSLCCAALIASVLAAPAAPADAAFAGRWVEAKAERHCSVVRGFDLRPDGAAAVEWAALGGVEQRSGRWTARAEKFHLAVIEVLSDPAEPKRPGRPSPLSIETDVDGALNAAGELDTVITNTRDRNIDGAPYAVRCAYVRPPPPG